MYYLVECTGEYDDYREEAIEFSSDEFYLESKAAEYNDLVEKLNKLRSETGYYLDTFRVKVTLEEQKLTLKPFVEKPKNPPKTKEDHARFAQVKEQNEKIRQVNNQKLFEFRKNIAERFLQEEVPEKLKNLFYVDQYTGFLNVRSFHDLSYTVKEIIKPRIERWKNEVSNS